MRAVIAEGRTRPTTSAASAGTRQFADAVIEPLGAPAAPSAAHDRDPAASCARCASRGARPRQGFGKTNRRDRWAISPIVQGRCSRSARRTCSSSGDLWNPIFDTGYEVDGYLSPLFSPLIVFPNMPAVAEPRPAHPVDPDRLPGHLLLLPQGVLPVLLRGPAGLRRRRADDAHAGSAGERVPVHPPEPAPVHRCTSRSSRCSSCGSTSSAFAVPRTRRAAHPGRLGQRAVPRQRRAADRLLAVVPLAAPPRRRPPRLLLVHPGAPRPVHALAAADGPEPEPHVVGLVEPHHRSRWRTSTSGCWRWACSPTPRSTSSR